MRILDQAPDRSLSNLTLHLTSEEVVELRDEIDRLIVSKSMNDHDYVSDFESNKEITVALYGRHTDYQR